MSDTEFRETAPSPLPPTKAEMERWARLTRDEQIALYRAHLSHPACDRVGAATMADVLTEARARLEARRG